MADLITIDETKARLRILYNDDDVDLALLISQVSAAVVSYCKRKDTDLPPWDASVADSVPPDVALATLVEVARQFADREGVRESRPDPGSLSQAAVDLLWRHRDPALA